jgi:tetratricopeptide (TPR) repeat protein
VHDIVDNLGGLDILTNVSNPSLLSIIAFARSGSLDRAWRMFEEHGAVDDDPAVLSVRGRLLKDRARGAEGSERKRLFLEAADAYARAAQLGGATYPLINAATLSLLAGQRDQAEILARGVLERGEDQEETPYYRAATRAEAFLLTADIAQAKAEFAAAIARAPRAYEDHASTLRQFALILDELGEDKAWLDPLRPPRSLHFAGHMSLPNASEALQKKIRDTIGGQRIVFAYGALAAGADILIAEALLDAGAELHLVLPGSQAQFREKSVAPFGDNWSARFDRIVAAADTIRSVAVEAGAPATLAIQLAAEVAMGSAVMQADTLTTEAVQLLILDRNATMAHAGSGSDRIGAVWTQSGRRQIVLTAPRIRGRTARSEPETTTRICLAAMLRIDISESGATAPTATLERLAAAIEAGPKPLFTPRWTGEAVLVAYDGPAAAADAALSAAHALGDAVYLRIAGHYGLVRQSNDPFGGSPLLTGAASLLPAQMIHSTPRGAVHVTEDFGAALRAHVSTARLEFVGELPGADIENPTRLYSLKC